MSELGPVDYRTETAADGTRHHYAMPFMRHPPNFASVGIGSEGEDPFVRLDSYMADDLSVVNSARVSLGVRHWDMEAGDAKLIEFLMVNRHGTPFEHNAFRFHVRAPLFIFREWQRHRIGSFNELSARYKEIEPVFYVPRWDHVRSQVGKPGAYRMEPLHEDDAEIGRMFRDKLKAQSEAAFAQYKAALDQGIAKELARCFLPVNMYSEMYWTVNARSLMNFLSLRNSEFAMLEIREYAKTVEAHFQRVMPITHAAFVANERVAP